MTKEEILKAFAADDTFAEKTNLSEEQIVAIKFHQKSSSKLVEVIKIAIDGVTKDESESIISRKIQTYLNR